MAEALIFHYRPGTSLLHRLDPLIKLAGLLCFSLLLLRVSYFRLLGLLPLLLAGHSSSSFRIRPFLKESRFFLIMGGLVLLSTGLNSGSFLWGLLKMLRFFAILWMALLFSHTTDPLSIHGAVYRLLRPVPLLPARAISTVLSLSLTMLPLILDQLQEIREAMLSRCGLSHRTPLRNLIRLGLPLLSGILVKAEDLSDAMEARLFREDATPPEPGGGPVGLPLLFLAAAALLLPAAEAAAGRAGWGESLLFRQSP